MPYQALYRKWRPDTFDKVRGQDTIVKTLKNQIVSDRMGHAYLFCGTRGTGKTSIAKIYAKAVNCEHPVEGSPCGECATCKAIAAGTSLNVVEIDAASNNGVDNIRDIREQVQYPPTEGRYKVYIIDEVHMLSAGAFNALLKTLEEPPEYVIFILATTEVHKIPVTIMSRCQRYDFKRIPIGIITEHLRELMDEEKIDVEDKALKYIARAADGAMRDALSLLDQCVAFHLGERLTYENVLDVLGAVDTKVFGQLFRAVASADTGACLAMVEELLLSGRDLSQAVTDFIWYLRNVLVIQSAPNGMELLDVSEDAAHEIAEAAGMVSQDTLMRYIRIFSELSGEMKYSGQKRVLLEMALVKLTKPEMENSYEALMQRVEMLEEKLATGNFTVAAGGSADGAAVQEAAVSSQELEEKRVTLPKAQYDDLMLVKKEWNRIANAQSGPVKRMLMDTDIQPDGEGKLVIVCYDEGHYDFLERDNGARVKEVENYICDKYEKQLELGARYVKPKERVAVTYVSMEDIESAINIEVTVADDAEGAF